MSRYMIMATVAHVVLGSAAAANAQTVQLPTFEFFGASTTVVVPNQGEIAVVGRGGRVGVRNRGAFAGSSRGGTRTVRGAGISAVVHDLAELDRQVLAQAARMRPRFVSSAPARRLPASYDQSSAAKPDTSLREIRRLQDAARQRLAPDP